MLRPRTPKPVTNVNDMQRRYFLSLLGAGFAAGCAPSGIVSRDTNDPFEGGIGGTGIVGLMTDEGSVLINGLRVELTGRTRLRSAVGAVSEGALRPGAALTIVADYTRDRLVAKQIDVAYPLIGTVRRHNGQFSINGSPVLPEAGALGRLTNGARVAVSGVWSRNALIATRIEPAHGASDVVAGTVGRSRDGAIVIGRTKIKLDRAQAAPISGLYATAIGRFEAGVLDVTELRMGRFDPRAGGFRQLSVEGFLEPVTTAPGFRIAGLGHSFDEAVQLAPLAARRAIYFGRYDGQFRAGRGYVLPQNFAQRRALLRPGLGEGYAGQIVSTRS